MKIAMIGYGKMGQLIEEIALKKEHEICAKIDSKLPTQKVTPDLLKKADVCIDFSQPGDVLDHIRVAGQAKVNLVMGTTGWYEHLSIAQEMVKESGIGFLYSPNFSIGVNLFFKIVSAAAHLMNEFDDYDVAGIEYHHNEKKDAPSGTAEHLTRILLNNVARKQSLQFSSVRCGSIPGTHSILFDSPADTLTLSHEARNRSGFAAGALVAADWLKNRKGFYTFDDVLKDLYEKN
jgi:4-hydroxy-tetrahydrodipicolinate reductase